MRKAQESAPVELLIGVVILTFVLIIGMSAYQNLCSSQYEQKLKASISKLAQDLELVYMGSTGSSIITNLDLNPPAGCGYNIRDVRILRGSVDVCKARLGRDSCLVIIATVQEKGEITGQAVSEVVNIPDDVNVYLDMDPTACNTLIPDLNYWSDPTNYAGCWLQKTSYSLSISKTSPDEIVISKAG